MGTYKLDYNSPIGVMEIVGTERVIQSILFIEGTDVSTTAESGLPEVMEWCQKELNEYFNGERTTFTFPFEQPGTPFQREVWNSLREIPYGETISYRELAERVSRPKAVRAVGSTNGRNGLSIVVPCHRVIGSNGTLTGYAGGLWRKEWLLHHEQQNASRPSKKT